MANDGRSQTKTKSGPRIDSTNVPGWVLLGLGGTVLTASIVYSSSILAFIGLGLVLWGIVIKYITTEEYVKKTLLDTTTLSSLRIMDEMLKELGYNSKAVYLPPKYLREIESSKIYIAKHEETKLPTPARILQENKAFIRNPEAIVLTPPGNELTKLFEKTLNISFTKVDLAFLVQEIPSLLVEDLEIAENIEIKIRNSTIHVRIENSIYKDICKETETLSSTFPSLGCPISSSIACALAKASGKPVVISKHQTSDDGKIIDIEYETLREPEEKS